MGESILILDLLFKLFLIPIIPIVGHLIFTECKIKAGTIAQNKLQIELDFNDELYKEFYNLIDMSVAKNRMLFLELDATNFEKLVKATFEDVKILLGKELYELLSEGEEDIELKILCKICQCLEDKVIEEEF